MNLETSTAVGQRGDLRLALGRTKRLDQLKSGLLVSPLLLYLLLIFVLPIMLMLFSAISNPELPVAMPKTAVAMREWDGDGLPSNDLASLFAAELVTAQRERTLGQIAKRLNRDIGGFRSLILKTGNKLSDAEEIPKEALAHLTEMDLRWSDPFYWRAIKRASSPVTDFYLLSAFDLARDDGNRIVRVPSDDRVYVSVTIRTIWISMVVTVCCLLLGYPLSYLLATVPPRTANVLMLLVLVPFYTSLLVRTTGWLVLLQNEGLVNDLAQYLGLIENPVQLVRNRAGVYIAMTHILLPFMVFPIYSVMKGIPREHLRAARSLGAGPIFAFRHAYMPQTLPGVTAGCILVFISSLGYYVTPALVGGPGDQMVSYFIAYYTNQSVDWGMAAALSLILLSLVLLLFVVFNRVVGLDKMKMG